MTLPAAKGSDSSDSDYEHYDFSSKPPVALSTFYSEPPPAAPCHPGSPPLTGSPPCSPADSLRRRPGEQQPGEQLHPLVPNQDGMEPFPAEGVPAPVPLSRGTVRLPAHGRASERCGPDPRVTYGPCPAVPATTLCSPPWGRANSLSSSSSSSSSMEPYCNESAPPLHAWPCPQPPAYSPPQQAAPTAPGCTLQPCTGEHGQRAARGRGRQQGWGQPPGWEWGGKTPPQGWEWGVRPPPRDGNWDEDSPRGGNGDGETPRMGMGMVRPPLRDGNGEMRPQGWEWGWGQPQGWEWGW